MITSFVAFRQPHAIFGGLLVGLSALAFTAAPATANFIDPCGKYVTGSKKWKKCKRANFLPGPDSTDDERFMAGYWLAKNGRYQEALGILTKVKNWDDPRVWNYIGYATRKLGRIDEALVYYQKALELSPDYVMSRAYMGEALLIKGNLTAARNQLGEIAKRCGTSCEAYLALEAKIQAAGT